MKNSFMAILTAASLLSATSCQKSKSETTNSEKESASQEQLVIDSVVVKESSKLSNKVPIEYISKMLVFPSIKEKALLDSIYADSKGLTDFSKEGLKAFMEKEIKANNERLNKTSNNSVSPAETWKDSYKMTEKYNKNNYLYIQYVEDGFEGGLHGNTLYTDKVFDLKNNKKLQLADISSMSKDKISEVLKKNLEQTSMMLSMKKENAEYYKTVMSKPLLVPKNFYFDDNKLYFHYNEDEIFEGGHTGDIIVTIPFVDLQGTLNPEFKERMKIK